MRPLFPAFIACVWLFTPVLAQDTARAFINAIEAPQTASMQRIRMREAGQLWHDL